ncbi:hypothetical protein ACFL17_00550, partial [Pseudomonadota bacterium]
LTKDNQLCSKLMGLQKDRGACFAYQLDQCKGACVGEESVWQHNMRLLKVLQPIKVVPWPYKGRIGIREACLDGQGGEMHILENWCLFATVEVSDDSLLEEWPGNNEIKFDVDVYNIVRRYLSKKRRLQVVEFPA